MISEVRAGHRAPSQPWLGWGIRAGFRDYLDGLEDLSTVCTNVEWDEAGSRWVFLRSGLSASSLRFSAHGGALNIELRDLSVVGKGEDMFLADGSNMLLARLLGTPTVGARGERVYGDVALTNDGSTLFGGVYAPWARMDPISVSVEAS